VKLHFVALVCVALAAAVVELVTVEINIFIERGRTGFSFFFLSLPACVLVYYGLFVSVFSDCFQTVRICVSVCALEWDACCKNADRWPCETENRLDTLPKSVVF